MVHMAPCDQAPVPQVVVDESRLIDLPLAEQKRRGNELLSLLSDPWLHCAAKGTGRLPSGNHVMLAAGPR